MRSGRFPVSSARLSRVRVLTSSLFAVLAHSAAGGVGSMLVQLGKLADCRVIGVVGAAHKVDAVHALGAAAVIDKSTLDLWKQVEQLAPAGCDIILDANGTLFPNFFPALDEGAICTVSVDVIATGSELTKARKISRSPPVRRRVASRSGASTAIGPLQIDAVRNGIASATAHTKIPKAA